MTPQNWLSLLARREGKFVAEKEHPLDTYMDLRTCRRIHSVEWSTGYTRINFSLLPLKQLEIGGKERSETPRPLEDKSMLTMVLWWTQPYQPSCRSVSNVVKLREGHEPCVYKNKEVHCTMAEHKPLIHLHTLKCVPMLYACAHYICATLCVFLRVCAYIGVWTNVYCTRLCVRKERKAWCNIMHRRHPRKDEKQKGIWWAAPSIPRGQLIILQLMSMSPFSVNRCDSILS